MIIENGCGKIYKNIDEVTGKHNYINIMQLLRLKILAWRHLGRPRLGKVIFVNLFK
jgi:hypothetical protein